MMKFFLKALMHRADLVMEVKGFTSGISKEVTGELTFQQNPGPRLSGPKLHYKILENTVKFQNVRKDSQ